MKLAVLGCGSIGQRHISNLLALGESELIACDVSIEARQATATTFGVETVPTLADVWDWGPQAVLITAPTNMHIRLAQEAANHGAHLFIEKPLSHSIEGIETLSDEADRRGLITMVGCNMRFHPGPATVKRTLESGVVGEVLSSRIQTGSYLPRWRSQQDYKTSYSASQESGGAILDCIHEIDLATWYLGPAELMGSACLSASSLGLKTDGLAEILLRHETGALSSVHLNFVQRDYKRACQIIGTEGTIYWDFIRKTVQVFDTSGNLAEEIPEADGWHLNQMYVDELEHFRDSAALGKETVNPLSNGLAVLKIALAVRNP